MKCKDIMKILEANISHEYAEDWDNVGLLAGDGDREVKKIMLIMFVHFYSIQSESHLKI